MIVPALYALDRLEVTPIPGTENARNPRFSPDGRSVAFTGDESLSTVSLSGAPPLRLVSDSVVDGSGGRGQSVRCLLTPDLCRILGYDRIETRYGRNIFDAGGFTIFW